MATGKIKSLSKAFTWNTTYRGLNIIVNRVGNVCTAILTKTTTAAIAAYDDTIATIPSAYCPTDTIEFINYARNITFYLNPAGLLRVRENITSGTAISTYATYITTNAEPT